MYCYKCGEKLEEGEQFCLQCGSRIEEKAKTAVSSQLINEEKAEAARQREIEKSLGSSSPPKPKGTIIRIASVAVLICFLFLPQVSCASLELTGIDIMQLSGQPSYYGQESGGVGFLLLSILIIGVCVAVFIFPRGYLGAIGLGAQIAMLIAAKGSEAGPMLKIGAGAILSAIGFLVVVFGDRIEQLLAKYREK